MTGSLGERIRLFLNNRWLVFVAAMWMQSWAGVGYLFGSISPVIKSSLNYNQRQVARLGVAKDLGDCVGFFAGTLCEILPLWAALLIGALQNLVGYGWVWLIVTGRVPVLPLWAMCVLIFVGTNGETYFNTAALVSCVQNFPKSRGPVVGILKGFAGLSGAILTQIYTVMHSPDHASFIFMIAVGPTMVVIALMFIVRPVGGHTQIASPDSLNFSLVHSICLILAAYLMGVMLVQDLVDVSETLVIIFTVILLILLFIPVVIPISLSFTKEPILSPLEEALLLPEPQKQEPGKSESSANDFMFSEIESEIEDEKQKEAEAVPLPGADRQKRIAQLQAKLAQAAAEGAVRIKKRRPRRGEDFTLLEALMKADFWLIFFSLLLGSGSGLTAIDNLGQISQSLGYEKSHVFVSMISIWNFLGRVGGGYISEKIVKDYAYPRPAAIAGAQAIMAVGHVFFAMGWPGAMYIGTLLVGLGYGAHWAVVPAAASELFGLKKFAALYNFITLANPAGSLVFSGVIASGIYDREAERQAGERPRVPRGVMSSLSSYLYAEESLKCEGSVCFFLTFMIMTGFCMVGVVLSMILVYRTKSVYTNLYGRAPR